MLFWAYATLDVFRAPDGIRTRALYLDRVALWTGLSYRHLEPIHTNGWQVRSFAA